MEIELIIFDLDDTLMPEHPPVEAAFLQTAQMVDGVDAQQLVKAIKQTAEAIWYAGPWHEYGSALGIAWWEGISASFEGEGPRLQEMREWCLPFRLRVWQEGLDQCGVDASLAEKLAEQFPLIKAELMTTYDGAIDVVDELAESYRIAMLTNGVPDLQHEKLKRSGLIGRFEPLVISGAVGIGKPDSSVFEHLLKQADISADKSLMVGNSLTSDIGGAKNAGMPCVWVDIDKTNDPRGQSPDATIQDIRELPEIVAKLAAN